MLLWVLVLGSALAMGTVHASTTLVVAPIALVAGGIALRAESRLHPSFWIFVALALYTLLQSVPLPAGVVQALSPAGADVWERSLLPFGEDGPTWLSLSIAPGASSLEALKWLSYAGAFLAACRYGFRKGGAAGARIVFVSGCVVALLTVVHTFFGIEKVYGFYEPRFAGGMAVVGPLLNANNLGGYLNLAALSGLGLLLGATSPKLRLAVASGVAILLATSVLSASRGGLLALPLGLIVLVWLGRRQVFKGAGSRGRLRGARASSLVLGTVMVGALIAWVGMTQQRSDDLFDDDTGKLELISKSRDLISDFPWFGVGRGGFHTGFLPYREGGGHGEFVHAENFVVQWITEWGLPVAIAALGAFLWTLRPNRLDVDRSPHRAGVYAGAFALVAHNLVDLALEVPGVMLALVCVLGVCVGASAPGRSQKRGPTRWTLAAWTGVSLVVFAVALTRGSTPIYAERDELHLRVEKAENDQDAAELREDLRAAMLRHPGDAYLPYLGAVLAANRRDQSPMPWLQRSLERDPNNGRTHYLVAYVLARRGFASQALLQLRLALQRDVRLLPDVASLALVITKKCALLAKAAPRGNVGARLLNELRGKVPRAEAITCLQAALERSPKHAVTVRRLGALRLEEAERAPSAVCPSRAECLEQAVEHAQTLKRVLPNSSQGAQLEARALLAEGKAGEAQALLADICRRKTDEVSCLSVLLTATVQNGDIDAAHEAAKALLQSSCLKRSSCGATATRIAYVFAQKNEQLLALSYYERAARELDTADSWLRAAKLAKSLDLEARAASSLRRARRLDPNDSELEKMSREVESSLEDQLKKR